MEEGIPRFQQQDDFMSDLMFDGEFTGNNRWFLLLYIFVDILNCENEDLLNGDLFGDETMAQLNADQLPLDLIDDVRCNQFMNPSDISPNNNFETLLPNRTTYSNIPSPNHNLGNTTYPQLPLQANLQIKNVSLPVQNPTTVIISSPNVQHNTQPLVYTSLPVENQQHIILQPGNAKPQSNGHKNAPVILQNIQQPVLLQAKLIKGDNQVCHVS